MVLGSIYYQKALQSQSLRVEILSMQNWVEDTRSLDSPVAPDPCRQIQLGEQPGYIISQKITISFNPQQPCLLPAASFLEKQTA